MGSPGPQRNFAGAIVGFATAQLKGCWKGELGKWKYYDRYEKELWIELIELTIAQKVENDV